MTDVSTARAEPGLFERWAVRAGLVKAAQEHHEWLLADCAVPGASRNIQMVIAADGHPRRRRRLAAGATTFAVGFVVGTVTAAEIGGRGNRRRRQLLRRHGLADPSTMTTSWSRSSYAVANVLAPAVIVGVVVLVYVLALS